MVDRSKWILVAIALLLMVIIYQQRTMIKGFDTLIVMEATGRPVMLYGFNEGKDSWSRLRIDDDNHLIVKQEQ